MRQVFPLSSGWHFTDSPMRDEWLGEDSAGGGSTKAMAPTAAGPAWIPVDVPHTLVTLPFNHFDEASYQKRGTYKREFDSPRIPEGGSVFLDFEGVAVSCRLWLNGRNIGGHSGPYTPFSINITETIHRANAVDRASSVNRAAPEGDASPERSVAT